MKVIKKIIILLAFVSLFAACDDLFDPAPERIRDLESVIANPEYAQGLLIHAYAVLPFQTKSTTDIATDDAVTNDITSSYLRMATGSWSSLNDPMSQWQARRAVIQYLNTFFSIADQVTWVNDENVNEVYHDRILGEAHALRALNTYYLLQAHGGWTADGRLLGIPNLTEPEGAGSDFNKPRNTFQECIDQVMSDLTTAIELLPLDYQDISNTSQVPTKYPKIGYGDYNRAAGTQFQGRLSGRIAEAIRAQVALLAASPAYSEGTNVTWADAANAAAVVLNRIGGVSGMPQNGWTWYMNKSEIDPGFVPAEIIWTGKPDNGTADYQMGFDQEKNNYPPSLYGRGRINPSQNLVDAFPMASGYPITESGSGYLATDPYKDRDPRLNEYILLNGTKYGVGSPEIITGTYSSNNDGLNKDGSVSTRTGYYLRKLLRDDCNANPQYNTGQYHYPVRIRYTELFLIYAEAANEAWGPTNASGNSYSAYDVIKAIRARAGVGADNGDAYLESIKNDQAKMRELIRNERRIELSFENKRFWDLRRWELPLTETVRGMQIDRQADGTLTYTPINVETRNYLNYMYYGPIPNGEVLKWSNLEQNAGW